RVELSAGDKLLLREADAAVAGETRVVHHRAGLADDRGLLVIDLLVAAGRRKPEPRARLLQRRLGLVHPELEVALVELADHLAALHARAEVDGDLGQTTGDLRAEHDLIVSGQSSRRRDRACDGALGGRRDLHLTRGRSRGFALLLLGADFTL